jgi:16S rRNA (guanine527-N7)-methyltransferase
MPWASLRPLLPGGPEEVERLIGRLREFATELLRWNQGVSNLVSHDDEPRLIERHLAESLAGFSIINSLGCKRLVDFGSGGGFPALPLAIAGAGEHWTLVESRRNKTLFLRRAVQVLKLGNVDVLTGRLEALQPEELAALRADALTSRATQRLGPTLELAAKLVPSGGHAILWKGSGVTDELTRAGEQVLAEWSEPVTHRIGESHSSVIVFTKK